MLLVGSGYGYLVPAVVFLDSLAAELISESLVKNDEFYQDNFAPLALSLIISGSIIQAIENRFQRKWEDGEDVRLLGVKIQSGNGSFFFIPVQYWPKILWVMGLSLIVWQYWPKRGG